MGRSGSPSGTQHILSKKRLLPRQQILGTNNVAFEKNENRVCKAGYTTREHTRNLLVLPPVVQDINVTVDIWHLISSRLVSTSSHTVLCCILAECLKVIHY